MFCVQDSSTTSGRTWWSSRLDGTATPRYVLNKLNKLKTLIILIHVQVYMGDWTDVVSCFVYSQGASYDPSGMNYRCPCCDKQTRTMQASFLLLHVRAGD